jgi:hypothetical protein
MSMGSWFLRFVNGVVGSSVPRTWHKCFDRLRPSRFLVLVVGFGNVGETRCFRWWCVCSLIVAVSNRFCKVEMGFGFWLHHGQDVGGGVPGGQRTSVCVGDRGV